MKILILDEEFPYPTNTGKRTRSFNLYSRLAKIYSVRYIGYGVDGSESADALTKAGLEQVAVATTIQAKEGFRFYLKLLENILSPLPYIVTSHYSRCYQDAVNISLRDFNPDVIICEWTPYVQYVKHVTSVKIIVSTHNVEADIWQRYSENESSRLKRWYILKQWRKVELFERDALRHVSAATAVSQLDRDRFISWQPNLPIKLVPNGVDLSYFHAAPQPENRTHLVFTGSMDWRPNQDAARYFVRDIFPLVQDVYPEIQCTFVGRSPPPDIQALEKLPGVQITGTVDDVRPYIERAAVYIVPLRVGGGSRLKILEALAMSRAVVSTSVGAEGLDVTHGVNLLLADEPIRFAAAIMKLIEDQDLCKELAIHGRQLVERQYGWDAVADTFSGFINELTQHKTS